MSAFLPDSFKEQETKKPTTPQQGPEAYFSPEERKMWQRFTSFPEELSPKFRSWLIDFIAVNIPQIPISQIVGFNQVEQVEVTTATVATDQSTTSGSYTDLTTVGPQLTGLRAGRYIVQHGCLLVNDGGTSGWKAFQSVSVNGAAAVDGDAVQHNVGSNGDQTCSVATTLVKDLTGTTNTIVCKYRIGIAGNCRAANRWLVAQRIGPVPA